MAEWIMNNRAALNLKYVIWGQRIWSVSQDTVKPWAEWRLMEDRGSITANHWFVIFFFSSPPPPVYVGGYTGYM